MTTCIYKYLYVTSMYRGKVMIHRTYDVDAFERKERLFIIFGEKLGLLCSHKH